MGSATKVNQLLLADLETSKLCIIRSGDAAKTRRFSVAVGFGPKHNLGVYNPGVDTVARALTERYFFCKEGEGFRKALAVDPSTYRQKRLKTFRELVMVNMPNLPRLTASQTVALYRGVKRKLYQRAHESLDREALVPADARLRSFPKCEKQDISKAPRCINPRSPRYNLELARYLKPAEKRFYEAINMAFGGKTSATVLKGMNADRMAAIMREKWDRFDDPVAVGLDASKFDMHVSVPALRYEQSFYKSLFPGSRMLRALLKLQLRNTGTAYCCDGKVKFSIEGTRSSGDINTSLGNCIIMCALIWSYLLMREIDAELANNGDDAVVIMERRDLEKFTTGLDHWFRIQGFAMVVEKPATEFEEIEFCQTKPVLLSTGWRMMRTLASCLAKDPICILPMNNAAIYKKWLGAVGECGMSLARGTPILESFYNAFLRNGTKSSEKFKDHVFKNTSMYQRIDGIQEATITPESRASFYYAFGVLPDEQKIVEKLYDNLVIEDINLKPIEREHLNLESGLIFDSILNNKIQY